uniref:PTS glucose transporter subunit IIA n=1 Tax=Janibacter limosus TaxID=53458 RepID=A0AC61U293_9MICO|nr:PTS glucose transporter subunit IIA [Janibacter limosus]
MSEVLAPCAGRVLPITECVDEVFGGQLVGPGLVIDPPDGGQTVVAPIAGTVMKIHPHAFVVVGEGAGVLVHLGINTVRLEGAGFEVHATRGSIVAAGDPMITRGPVRPAERGCGTSDLTPGAGGGPRRARGLARPVGPARRRRPRRSSLRIALGQCTPRSARP